LSTPYVVQIFPIYACNFSCYYCGIFNKKKKDRFFISDKVKIEWELFKKFIIDMKKFPEKVKIFRFVGVGEPLLHKELCNMIWWAKVHNIAEKIEVITNGSLLNKDLSFNLITSGLDRLVISLQGLSSEDYKEVSNVNIDFDEFVENIKYLYNLKKLKGSNLHIYVKIADISLKSKEDEKRFYDVFGKISDSLAIEHIVPLHTELSESEKTQFGEKAKDIKICSLPFYFLELRPDGNVTPCYSFQAPIHIGNVYEESIVDIWNSDKMKEVRLKMINEHKQNIDICKTCGMSKYRYHVEDDLDNFEEKLKKIY
jgi:radical SAM protein with 4Fe4S-binding SPASM domain